jgi:serine/threonine protein kinase
MKIIPKGLISVAPRLKEEIKILLRVRHKNIISLIRAGETENELFLHMELAEGGRRRIHCACAIYSSSF